MTQANAATVEVGVIQYGDGLIVPSVLIRTQDVGEAEKLSEANGLTISLVEGDLGQHHYLIGIHKAHLIASQEDMERFFEEDHPSPPTPMVFQFLLRVSSENHEKFWPLYVRTAAQFVLVPPPINQCHTV